MVAPNSTVSVVDIPRRRSTPPAGMAPAAGMDTGGAAG